MGVVEVSLSKLHTNKLYEKSCCVCTYVCGDTLYMYMYMYVPMMVNVYLYI